MNYMGNFTPGTSHKVHLRTGLFLCIASISLIHCRNHPAYQNNNQFSQNAVATYSQDDLVRLSTAQSNQQLVTVMITSKHPSVTANSLSQLGASVSFVDHDFNYLTVALSPSTARDLPYTVPTIETLAVDHAIDISPIERDRISMGGGELGDVRLTGDNGHTPYLATEEIGAKSFTNSKGYNGQGITIAVLDTGLALRHPALKRTTSGTHKIIDYQDFTKDGDLSIQPAQIENNSASNAHGTLSVGDIGKDSSNIFIGVLKESSLKTTNDNLSDVNRDGDHDDIYLVLIFKEGSNYITYIDTDRDQSIENNKPIGAFKDTHDIVSLDSNGLVNAALILNLDTDNNLSSAYLGFDSNSHGSHVAGIAAGNGFFNGKANGVAPGANVMAVKVLGNHGTVDSVHRGIIYAAKNGAHVINMSLGALPEINDGSSPSAKVVDQVTKKYGVVFTIAAGNEGPGINTVGMPATSIEAISVGASLSPETLGAVYGFTGLKETILWFFSSVGPRLDGLNKPDIVAPGSALSAAPLWKFGHMATQGTSMSAPFAAGAAALLLEACKKEELPCPPRMIKKALVETAIKLSDYSFIEQGSGMINIPAAYDYLKKSAHHQSEITYTVETKNRLLARTFGKGVYIRGSVPKEQNVTITKVFPDGTPQATINSTASTYTLKSDATWLNFPSSVFLIADHERSVRFNYDSKQLHPGIHTAMVYGDDESTPGIDFEIPHVVIIPHSFNDSNRHEVEINNTLSQGRVQRHFIKIPSETKLLRISLSQLHGNGLSRLAVTTPKGTEYDISASWVSSGNKSDVIIESPYVGLWEVDVFSSIASNSPIDYSLTASINSIVSDTKDAIFTDIHEGAQLTTSLALTNLYQTVNTKEIAQILGYESSLRTTVSMETQQHIQLIVPPATPQLVVQTRNPQLNTADIDIILLDPTGATVGASQRADSNESISVKNPAPGIFTLVLIGYKIANTSQSTNIDVIQKNYFPHSIDFKSKRETIERESFEFWLTEFSLESAPPAPPKNFHLFGSFDVSDTKDNVLFSLPIKIHYTRDNE